MEICPSRVKKGKNHCGYRKNIYICRRISDALTVTSGALHEAYK